MRRKILKCFGVIVLILIAMGFINLLFFLKINRSINEIADKRFAVEQQVQQGHVVIGRIHNDIWDAMLFDLELRKNRIKILDDQALIFYGVLDELGRLLPEDMDGLKKLRRHFQTFYLMGKDILQLPDLATFQRSSDDITEFRRQKARLSELIDFTFTSYKNQFIESLAHVKRHTLWLSFFSLLVILTGGILAILFSVRLSDTLTKPISRLIDTVNALTEGDLTATAGEYQEDEVGRLGAAFNVMTQRLRITMETLKAEIEERKAAEKKARRRRQQLIHADKMVSLGILAAGLAHEINNPNQFIMSHITPLQRAWEGASPILDRYYAQYGDFRCGGANYSVLKTRMPTIFSNIRNGSARIKKIIDELRQFVGGHPDGKVEPIDINQVVQSALTLVSSMVKKTTQRFSLEMGGDIPRLVGHYQRLEQVVVNLVQNACQSLTDKHQAICIKTYYQQAPEEKVCIEIQDEGEGIHENDLHRLTDPFFTTKRDKGGTGLGLSISSRIVMDHGGEMAFSSEKGKGTTSRIILPAA